jgi:hypothetical protein
MGKPIITGKMNTFGKILILIGVLFLLSVPLFFLISFIYDAIYHPHDMNLPGLLAVASLIYLAPAGVVILVIGLIMVFLSS